MVSGVQLYRPLLMDRKLVTSPNGHQLLSVIEMGSCYFDLEHTPGTLEQPLSRVLMLYLHTAAAAAAGDV